MTMGWALGVGHLRYYSLCLKTCIVTASVKNKVLQIQTKVLLADDAICTNWISTQL